MGRIVRKRTHLLAVLVVITSFAIPVQTAEAATCSGYSNYFDGFAQFGHPEHPYEGASSYMIVRNGLNCGGAPSSSFVTNWVMIASGGTSTYNGWGQDGFLKSEGRSMRWFSQFYDGTGTDYEERDSTFTVTGEFGVRHTFRVLWSYACYCLKATIDSTTWDTSSFNPYSSTEAHWGPQPWSPQFSAESSYVQSDIPGTANYPVDYSGLGAQRAGDDHLESMPCIMSAFSDSSRWHHAASSCTAFETWTG